MFEETDDQEIDSAFLPVTEEVPEADTDTDRSNDLKLKEDVNELVLRALGIHSWVILPVTPTPNIQLKFLI